MIFLRGQAVAGFGLAAPPPQNIPVCGEPGAPACDRLTLPAGHRYVIAFQQLYEAEPAFPLSASAEDLIRHSSPLSDFMEPVDWVRALNPADNLGAASPQAPWAMAIAVQGFVKKDWMLISSTRLSWAMVAQVPDSTPTPPAAPNVPPQVIAPKQVASSGGSGLVAALSLVGLAAVALVAIGARR